MIKAGVIGAGHLGKIHLHLLKSSKFYDLVGFYDSDRKNAEILNNEKAYKKQHFQLFKLGVGGPNSPMISSITRPSMEVDPEMK